MKHTSPHNMVKVKQSRLEIFGSKNDPEVQASIKRATVSRREKDIKLVPGPSHDTGLGPCGKKLCHCQHGCALAYGGDQGATMGTAY